MDNKILPHLGLLVADDFPDKIIEDYKNELSAKQLNLQIHKFPFSGAYASLEWAIPTFIVVYILKPYFNEFLKEIAKDHYNVLKNWLKKTSANTRAIKITSFSADQSTDKLEKSNTQSKVFSIQTKTNGGQQLTFLFDEKLDSNNWNNAIDKVLNILDEHFTNGQSDELTIEIKNNNLEKVIYARLKTDTIDWEFLDYKKIAQEQ